MYLASHLIDSTVKDFLLITPPFTQLNTPYPATAYLKGFLNTKGYTSFQMDLGIEVILKLFSVSSLTHIFDTAYESDRIQSENAERIHALKDDYLTSIDAVISFLQGKNQTLARQICTRNLLPEAGRFDEIDDLEWAFGNMGMQDKAKHLATLYLEDISDFIIECIDDNFGFSRYAERIGTSANNFDELYALLSNESTYIDTITLELLEVQIKAHEPKIICFSVPFPGNLYSAFRCAQFIKSNYPNIKIAMGGGFPNTELRSVSDSRVFEFFDFISLDDGELPIELIFESLGTNGDNQTFKRTFICENDEVIYKNNASQADYNQADIGTPDYADLLLDAYISVIEIANPMHSLWSDGRWNKLTMAHGCYWGKCTFCDISLDYIKRYEPLAANLLVDRMEEISTQTGEYGFHFVDEAAPPALMRAVAIEIIRRKLTFTWWTNIRFEKSFTRDLCVLLKASGCIAISGGLEVASDRLLGLIDKGVTVEQVACVTQNLTDAGIMVHAYLMYGYPTQTIQETVDSLEMVRQLFEIGIIQSGFWHQFALTTHSPVGQEPEKYGVTPAYKEISFANNDLEFTDKTGIDHDKFSFGLKKSLLNFMHGIGFEIYIGEWFDFSTPATTIHPDYIEKCLEDELMTMSKPSAKPIWLGRKPLVSDYTMTKHGKTLDMIELTIHGKKESVVVEMERDQGEWFLNQLPTLSIYNDAELTLEELKTDFEKQFSEFELFWYSRPILALRDADLLVV
jgi:hypothetical protein